MADEGCLACGSTAVEVVVDDEYGDTIVCLACGAERPDEGD